MISLQFFLYFTHSYIKLNNSMGVMLQVKGEHLDVKEFFAFTKLKIHKKWYEMMKMLENKYPLEDQELPNAVVLVSRESQSFDTDVTSALLFLKANTKKLKMIQNFPGVDYATLQFTLRPALINPGADINILPFPAELLKIAGGLNLDLILINMFRKENNTDYDYLAKKPRFFA